MILPAQGSPADAASGYTAVLSSIPPQPIMLDPAPLMRTGRNWTAWAGGAFSIAILAAALWQLRAFDVQGLWAMLPRSTLFWVIFLGYFFFGVASEWVIFRRLWHVPLSGIFPLLRKQVLNELLLGYSGELYFYAWARRNANITNSPFGAIKDIAILSAVVGNLVTLAMVIVAAPLFQPMLAAFKLGLDAQTLTVSIGFVLATSLVILLLRRRLFSLTRPQLTMISVVHLVRILTMIGLSAWLWHLALPTVAISWWLLLSTWRQLVARLPFIPNKDIVFAALAAFLVGQDYAIGQLMAMLAALIVATNVAVGLLLAAIHFARLEPDT